ncbi:MAG: murein biosynthesis integral membrane protein MurJ [Candidatus Pacebacteria bacterium]|nr:murein biosynthesis integral membrane protein MurJ [Candidatus Paceibacterota bacterium]
MLKKIYNSKTKTITFTAALLALSGILSRVLGLLRDRLLAGNFGAGQQLDIYFAAFRIPDFVYGILIAGGVGAAFLPVFSKYFKEEDEKWSKESLELVNNVLNCFFLILIAVCSIIALFAPFFVSLVIPGFEGESRKLTIDLTRIMLFSPILFGLSGIFSGVLHYFNRFFAYSLAPILYNLGIIFGIVFLVPIFGIFGLAYGVILGAFFHLIVQVPAAFSSGYRYIPVFNFNFPGLRKIFFLMIPRMAAVAVSHINLIVITAIASTLAVGSIAVFNFSNNLHYFPVGIIGFSFAISSFPTFSKFWANGQKAEFFKNLSSSVRQILFLIVPASFLMFLLRAQIVRVVLGTGQFGWLETRLTVASLGIFCLGIFASGLVPLLSKAFFALHDTKTPLIIGFFSVISNISFSLFFVFLLNGSNFFSFFMRDILKLYGIENIEVIGLPLALSISAVFQFFLLFFFLYKKIGDFGMKEIYDSLMRIMFGCIFMSVTVYYSLWFLSSYVDMRTFFGVMSQALISGALGGVVYLSILVIINAPEIKSIKRMLYLK